MPIEVQQFSDKPELKKLANKYKQLGVRNIDLFKSSAGRWFALVWVKERMKNNENQS